MYTVVLSADSAVSSRDHSQMNVTCFQTLLCAHAVGIGFGVPHSKTQLGPRRLFFITQAFRSRVRTNVV